MYYGRSYDMQFDASGYYLNERRNDLQQRAKHLHYERQQNQVKTADFSKQISAARAALLELKNQAARALYAADITETALDPFEKAFGSWSGVAYVARMLERFTKKATEKTFSNMDQAQKDYQEIITKCAELRATLNS
jgi:chromosome segregation ATPase